jgi:formylglycine-generating enzyme required for sulfatase activity
LARPAVEPYLKEDMLKNEVLVLKFLSKTLMRTGKHITFVLLASFFAGGTGLAQGLAPERVLQLKEDLARFNPEAARRTVDDLAKNAAGSYDAALHRAAVEALARGQEDAKKALSGQDASKQKEAEALIEGARAALLANPLLDVDRLIAVRRILDPQTARRGTGKEMGFLNLNPFNHADVRRAGWTNDIVVISNLRGTPKITSLYRPDTETLIRDPDLDFDAQRLLFSGINASNRWALFEVASDGTQLSEVTPQTYSDVDWFDGCYLPDGRIVMLGTAAYQGLPCVHGSLPVAMLYQLDRKTGAIRQLTFEQDSDYTPTLMNDGRVVFTRWEYSDLQHYWSRILMTMNPDGTSQLALYGSNSYFPTVLHQCRAIPNDAHQLMGIVGGHHDVPEIGRLVLFDPTLSRSYPFVYDPPDKSWGAEGTTPFRILPQTLPKERTGMVHEFPGYGQSVPGDVADGLVRNQFERGKPYFVYPYPLSDKYVLVSVKTDRNALWGIYLVDVFDTVTRIAELEGAALFEPVPLAARKRPPVIPDRTTPGAKTASVHIADITSGPGLRGVPRGAVKRLRVFAYHFNYERTGGPESVGLGRVESSWDIKRILGTVEVESDGSVCFEIPANTPVSLQPLDADGAALQLMRSWLVGMPGERVSCLGCHEDNRSSVTAGRALADTKPIQKIKPFQGPVRPFGFECEVWPVAQKYCLGCHGDASTAPLRGSDQGGVPGEHRRLAMSDATSCYHLIHPYVRRPGPESEMALLNPLEWHVSTSPLVQMLKKGHHGVTLDRPAWETLYTWIDLNAPWRGKWSPPAARGYPQAQRRIELKRRFEQADADPESEYDAWVSTVRARGAPAPVIPQPDPGALPDTLSAAGFPMDAGQAKAAQTVLGEARRTVKLPNGEAMTFMRIPAGTFVMGSTDGYDDERPRAVVTLKQPFWMSEAEVKNSQYRAFDPGHDSRYQDLHGMDHTVPGDISNHRDQPVVRISWQQAAAFCDWLGQTAGVKAALPTEAQWEWAARGGTATQFYWGGMSDDFSKVANLSDQAVRGSNTVGWEGGNRIQKRQPYEISLGYPLHEERFKDNWYSMDYVAQAKPNAWGLFDMVGNASEWTRSSYRPYPYADDDGRNGDDVSEPKVARGGSFRDRPRDAGASVRRSYASWQTVYDVGFRVVIDE